MLTSIYRNIAKGRDLINFDEFKELLKEVANQLAIKVPFLKTEEQKIESLYEILDLLDPKLQKRLKQNAPPFRGVGPILAPNPKEKEEEERQKIFKQKQERKMVELMIIQ